MIISKTPFRISFFGGGTDYPAWYREHGGSVLGATIDKHCFITCRYLPPFFDHKYRLSYRKTEHVEFLDEIEHPSIRETVRHLGLKEGLEIHHDADLPARSGLGSSSSFTVGLLKTLYALKGQMQTKMQLARDAIYIEQEMIKEYVGSQDQTHAAFGGINKISFLQNDDLLVNPITCSPEVLQRLNDSMLLFFTGFVRTASTIAEDQIKATPKLNKELSEMNSMVDSAVNILNGPVDSLNDFGLLLKENWKIKRSLTNKITNNDIDEIYNTAVRNGAIGGKLLGAGGGGFILFFAPPDRHADIIEKLKDLVYVKFSFEDQGSQIIFFQPNGPAS